MLSAKIIFKIKTIITRNHNECVRMARGKKRDDTETSRFGAPARICHDASRFYKSRLYEDVNEEQRTLPKEFVLAQEKCNKIFCKSSEYMNELPDGCIHLMITSPPYNASKAYDRDLNLDEYLSMLRNVWLETYRVLVPGGRACVNVANLGRKPYIPLHSFIIEEMLNVGFLMRGELIWNKSSSSSKSTAWGSWCSASNPVLRDIHEYILVFSKDTFKRDRNGKENSLEKDDFLEWTKSVWYFPTVPARRVGHPAPFPEELPKRLIHLYSYVGDVVLDPFVGSGTTCLAAKNLSRSYIGYDISKEYVELALSRLADH